MQRQLNLPPCWWLRHKQPQWPFSGQKNLTATLWRENTGAKLLHSPFEGNKNLSCARWSCGLMLIYYSALICVYDCVLTKSKWLGWQICCVPVWLCLALQRLPLLSHLDVSATLCCGGFWFGTKDSPFREAGQHLKKVIEKRNNEETQKVRYLL